MIKVIDELRQPDFVGHPVWRYVRYDSRMVEPVAQIPVADLEECIVGTLVSLANGSRRFAMVSNIDAHDPERNAHFIGPCIPAVVGNPATSRLSLMLTGTP